MENIAVPECFPGIGFSPGCVSPIPLAGVAALLLLYPISIKQVNPFVQIAICASLTAAGLSMGVAALFCSPSPGTCSACTHWVVGTSTLLSLLTVIVPSVGAIVGLGTAAALLMNALVTHFCYPLLTEILVAAASIGGMATLFLSKEMFLHWQLIAPPVVGGYLAAIASGLEDPLYKYWMWLGLAAISVSLHIRRRRVNSWLEEKQKLAVHSKESQIVHAMRSASPNMEVSDFEKMKQRLLEVVGGDREQVDRIVFGGGLY